MTDTAEHNEANFLPFDATERTQANELQVESAKGAATPREIGYHLS